ncbi:MAG: pilin [Patescibacteria group bacterium]
MKKLITLAIALSPSFALAQQLTDINSVAAKATNIGTLVVSLAVAFSVIWIIVNIVRYLIAGGEEDRKKNGMNIVWGIVGLFLIFSIWGLVNILRNSFRTDGNVNLESDINRLVPQIRSGSGSGRFIAPSGSYSSKPWDEAMDNPYRQFEYDEDYSATGDPIKTD